MGKQLSKWIMTGLLALLLCIPTGCTSAEVMQNYNKIQVRLILKYLTRDYRDEIISGAKTAANEYGIDLNTQSLSPGDDPAKQADMLYDALRAGADAVILEAEPSEALDTAMFSAGKAGVPLVLIDENRGRSDVFCTIGTDNAQMSRDVAAQLKKVAGGQCSVYLLNSVCPAGRTDDKKTLIINELAKYKEYHVESIDYNTEFQDSLKEIVRAGLRRLDNRKVIIALNGFSSAAAISAIKESYQSVNLIAFGSSLELVSEMENGRVSAMVVENAFSKGYLAVQNAVAAINKEAKPGDILLKARLVTLENLYLPENQKLIFPLT